MVHYHSLTLTSHELTVAFVSVFHKPTSTGLFTNFNSFIPMTYKKGLLLSLISRYFTICSSYQSFHCELQNFKQIFSLNGYPTSLIDNCIRTFASELSSTKYSRLNHLFIPALKRFFSFHRPTWFTNTHTTSQITFKSLPTYFYSFCLSSYV